MKGVLLFKLNIGSSVLSAGSLLVVLNEKLRTKFCAKICHLVLPLKEKEAKS